MARYIRKNINQQLVFDWAVFLIFKVKKFTWHPLYIKIFLIIVVVIVNVSIWGKSNDKHLRFIYKTSVKKKTRVTAN